MNALLVNDHFDPDNWPSKKTAARKIVKVTFKVMLIQFHLQINEFN
jgi:hypothetical protein